MNGCTSLHQLLSSLPRAIAPIRADRSLVIEIRMMMTGRYVYNLLKNYCISTYIDINDLSPVANGKLFLKSTICKIENFLGPPVKRPRGCRCMCH